MEKHLEKPCQRAPNFAQKKAQPIYFLLPLIFFNVFYHQVRTLLMFSAAI
jgi:hypothetical protein